MIDSNILSPAPSETEQGDIFEGTPYRFVAPVGAGGMGEVVEAEHIELGHRVAIKLLRPEHFARFDLRDRMRIEAQACARIRHDNLVPVFDFGETVDGRAFVAMDLLKGRSLGGELCARGFVPVSEAADIARQALAGLAAAHAAGIVHRDIKPDNLFLCDLQDGSRRVKVLDFGIAKIVEAASPQTPAPLAQPTAEGMTVGTPRWASPEQSRGDRRIDARTDVYSMGWVLYAMLTGRVPFGDRKTPQDLARAHNTELPALPSSVAEQDIPRQLDMLVLRAIAKRPGDRFPNAEAFRTALEPFLSPPGGAQGRIHGTVAEAPVPSAMTPEERGAAATVEASQTEVLQLPAPWVEPTAVVGAPVREAASRAASAGRRPALPLWFLMVMGLVVIATAAFVVMRFLGA